MLNPPRRVEFVVTGVKQQDFVAIWIMKNHIAPQPAAILWVLCQREAPGLQ